MRPRPSLLCAMCLLAWLAVPCGAVRAENAPEQAVTADQHSREASAAFDEVWRLVRDRFHDPTMHGLDWSAVGQRYRARAIEAGDRDARAVIVNRMLDELGASHTRLFTPDEPAYYQLADIFERPLQRQGFSRIWPSGQVTYPGIGIFTETDAKGRIFVTGVIAGAPAARGGLLVGDEIVAADGAIFQPVGSFRGKVGGPVQLTIRRAPEGPTLTVGVVPEELNPGAMFLKGLEDGARVITAANGRRIGYVHVWSYASWRYQSALEQLLGSGKLKDADAVVWDLRDGWGGAQPDYLDLFNGHSPTLTLTGHDGKPGLANFRWRKPVAMLVNQDTRSGKEVLARGFETYNMGPVIGTRTEGAVLAATAFLISDDTLLLLAIDDVLVDGRRIEGVGVKPTVPVEFDRRYAAGADPQLDRAVRILSDTAEP
jgi:carboxyl-terminal processing protease